MRIAFSWATGSLLASDGVDIVVADPLPVLVGVGPHPALGVLDHSPATLHIAKRILLNIKPEIHILVLICTPPPRDEHDILLLLRSNTSVFTFVEYISILLLTFISFSI